MPQAWCAPCRARGKENAATRLVPQTPGSRVTIPKCESCYKFNMPVELASFERPAAAEPEEEEPMPVPSNIDWKAIRARRDAGEKVTALAKELGVHVSSVYMNTTGGGKLKAKVPRATATTAAALVTTTNGAQTAGPAEVQVPVPTRAPLDEIAEERWIRRFVLLFRFLENFSR